MDEGCKHPRHTWEMEQTPDSCDYTLPLDKKCECGRFTHAQAVVKVEI